MRATFDFCATNGRPSFKNQYTHTHARHSVCLRRFSFFFNQQPHMLAAIKHTQIIHLAGSHLHVLRVHLVFAKTPYARQEEEEWQRITTKAKNFFVPLFPSVMSRVLLGRFYRQSRRRLPLSSHRFITFSLSLSGYIHQIYSNSQSFGTIQTIHSHYSHRQWRLNTPTACVPARQSGTSPYIHNV